MGIGRWKSAALTLLTPLLLAGPPSQDLQRLECTVQEPYTQGFQAKYELTADYHGKQRKLEAFMEFSKNDDEYEVVLRPHLGALKRFIAQHLLGADVSALDYWQATRGFYDEEHELLGTGNITVYRKQDIVADLKLERDSRLLATTGIGFLMSPYLVSSTRAILRKDACLEGSCTDSTYARIDVVGSYPSGPIDGFINILNPSHKQTQEVINPETKETARLSITKLRRATLEKDRYIISSGKDAFWGLEGAVYVTSSGIKPWGVTLPRSITTQEADIFTDVRLEWNGFGVCSPKH